MDRADTLKVSRSAIWHRPFKKATPVYETEAAENGYKSTVRALGREAQGAGANKKAAEVAAAKILYGILSQP